MPKPLAVDWHEVRTLALAIGVREAARRMGLPVAAVMQRSKREGWLVEQRANAAHCAQARAIVREEQGLSAAVSTAAEVLARTGPDTRQKLATAVNKAVTHLSGLKPKQLAGESTALLQHAKTGSIVHSWQDKGQAGPLVSLNFVGSAQAHEQVKVIDVTAEPAPDTQG